MTLVWARSLALTMTLLASLGAPSPLSAQADLVSRASRLDMQGDHAAAIALYRQALARAPESFDAQYGIARALDLNGDYEEARTHFRAAIEHAPDEGSRDQALRMLGVSWTFTRDAQQASRAFTQVFDRRSAAGNVAGAAEVANELGRVLLELGDLEGAAHWYRAGYTMARRQRSRSVADIDLAEMRWAHARARIAIRDGDAREARRQMARVKALLDKGTNPDQQVQYPYLAGYIAYYLNDDEDAIAELRRADQQDPFILLLLAQAYQRLGDAPAAREYYTKVLASTSHAINNAFARPIARRELARASGRPGR